MTQQSLWHWSQGGADEQGSDGRDGRESDESPDRVGVLDCSEVADHEAMEPDLARQLHVALERHAGPLDVTLTDNRRRMVSVSPPLSAGRPEVRLHHMFLEADEEAVGAVADLVQGRSERARPVLREYIREHRDAINFEPAPEELEQRGEHFDLHQIFEDARDTLEAAIPPERREATSSETEARQLELDSVEITWGRRGRGRKSIRFGSFDFDQRLIRVHPALDRNWVPRFFVEYIVYHEMLHAVFPPVEQSDGGDSGAGERRRVHTSEFERAEKQFPRYEEAQQWERRNLDRFLNRDSAS